MSIQFQCQTVVELIELTKAVVVGVVGLSIDCDSLFHSLST